MPRFKKEALIMVIYILLPFVILGIWALWWRIGGLKYFFSSEFESLKLYPLSKDSILRTSRRGKIIVIEFTVPENVREEEIINFFGIQLEKLGYQEYPLRKEGMEDKTKKDGIILLKMWKNWKKGKECILSLWQKDNYQKFFLQWNQ